jgi:hypothetical protein
MINQPSFPLLQAGISYWGVTTAAGNALGTTLVCADLDNHPTYVGNRVKVLTGGAWGQDRSIKSHAAGGILTIDPYTNAAGAAQQIAAGMAFVILTNTGPNLADIGLSLLPPRTGFVESWQLEVIDPALWAETDPATGAAWAVDNVWVPHLALRSAPNANETARLRSIQRWVASGNNFGPGTYVRRLHLAFEMRLDNVGNIDNTLSIFGLTAGGAATRATNNIMGFALVGDALQTLNDDGGVEETNTGFGETLTDWNLYHLAVGEGQVDFWLNSNHIATHAVTPGPDLAMYINFFLDTEAGGASTIGLGQVAAWTEVS